MKIKRILSSALVAAILFTTILSALPVSVSAMHSAVIDSSTKYDNDTLVAEILEPMLQYNYNSADEMLEAELEAGYLDYIHSADKAYSLYANRYTGVVYYVNNLTGQILTTNPYNPAYTNLDSAIRQRLMSQVLINYSTVGSTARPDPLYSYKWSAAYGQISVSPISSGLRVNYSIGDTSLRFLLPECVPEKSFENDMIIPMINTVEDTILRNLKNENQAPYFDYLDENGEISDNNRDKYGSVDTRKLQAYLEGLSNQVATYCESEKVSVIRNLITDAITLFITSYSIRNPKKYSMDDDFGKEALEKMYKDYPITKEGEAVYAVSANISSDEVGHHKRLNANRLKALCPLYSVAMMQEAEAYCGVVVKTIEKPLFRCAIEYSFNDDGTLSVVLPSSSITYDETMYVVDSIIINQFFGCGDMLEDGYIFYPDGSGTIVEYSDFYSNVNSERQNVTLTGSVYGIDYSYSKITGAHRENVSLPVYGMVSTTGATADSRRLVDSDKTLGGFFAIIEEGDAVSKISYATGGSSHKFASVYPIFQPFASDTFDLSATLSVSGLSEHKMFATERYNGSYTMRIKMLTNSTLGYASGAGDWYDASYVGMVSFYRDYLKSTGVISKLEDVKDDLPLYIEAFGSMEITKRILTFPVAASIALTRFEDIETMYNEFADAINKLSAKAEEYKALAEAETKDLILKAKYEEKAADYAKLAGEVQNITNINFRLTGFANGGMSSTYPAKVKWEKACGGERGLEALLDIAKTKNSSTENFGVFPEFDFLYISNVAAFDRVSNIEHVSTMIDNRYASKQVYDNISRKFISIFSMVINTEKLDDLYSKFNSDYSKIGHNQLSASTLGSDLNSNFDVEGVVDRDGAKANVMALLDRMANDDGYELMINSGNIYAVRYATHILDFSIDSSHFRYSSYSIPFTGMLLHGYVNYAGGALNYSGSDDYDLLRSIESGASLYYILCYDNTNYMKDHYDLSKYFGVDYVNWYASIVESYSKLNAAIGSLQRYEITDHKVVYAERKLDSAETYQLMSQLGAEFLDFADKQIYAMVNEAYDDMATNAQNKGRGIKVSVDTEALIAQALELFDIDRETLFETDFDEKLAELASYYETKYSGSSKKPYAISYDNVVYDDTYVSAYNAITGSACTDDDYKKTDYTCDLGNVVIVTYSDSESGDSVTFVLNYNIYDVEVRLDDGTVITLGKYEHKII